MSREEIRAKIMDSMKRHCGINNSQCVDEILTYLQPPRIGKDYGAMQEILKEMAKNEGRRVEILEKLAVVICSPPQVLDKKELIEEVLFQFSRHIKGDIPLNQLEIEIQDAIIRFSANVVSVEEIDKFLSNKFEDCKFGFFGRSNIEGRHVLSTAIHNLLMSRGKSV